MAILPPNSLAKFGHTIRKPIGRIHWAGTETATQFYGYLEGALESSERVVKEIEDSLPSRPIISKL